MDGFSSTNASLGLYPAILQKREDIYRRWGRSRLAAYWSVLVTLVRFRHPLTLRLEVDGTPRAIRTPLAFIGCNAYQLDLLGLPGGDQVRAGRLVLFLASGDEKLKLLNYAVRLLGKRLEAGRDFEVHFCEDVVIESQSRSRVVATDGERARMNSPFRFTTHKDGVQVIARRQEA